MIIREIVAREILDSRGTPTVWARVAADGAVGEASVPSGASVGKFEAVELRDGDNKRFRGKGVLSAVSNVNTVIASRMVGKNFTTQTQIDDFLCRLDGTENKSWLGANAILAVSIAAARACAKSLRMELVEYLCDNNGGKFLLPTPMMNILNGGAHAGNNVDIQEFMVMPVGANSFREALRMCAEIYSALKTRLKAAGLETGVGDEGGFSPSLSADEQAMEYILMAAEDAGLARDIRLALDAAASEWYEGNGRYVQPKSKKEFSSSQLADYWKKLCEDYPIISLEDPMAEDDYEGFSDITKKLRIQIVGDDLFVTNTKRIQQGIEQGMANSILIKPNQIGTVSEAAQAVALGRQAGYASILSHRSGETEDPFIADLSVALCTGQIKSGAPARSERTAKYNRLLLLEEQLGSQAEFLGGKTVKYYG